MKHSDLIGLCWIVASAIAALTVAPAVANAASPPTTAAPATATAEAGPDYRVSRFVLTYAKPHPEHPPLAELERLVIELGKRDGRYVAPSPAGTGSKPQLQRFKLAEIPGGSGIFSAGALNSICRQVFEGLKRCGLLGLQVSPRPADLDPATLKDLRPAGETRLGLVIETAVVKKVHAAATGPSSATPRVCERIERLSPLQPPQVGQTGSLLRSDRLSDYVDRLNRFGGRRVSAQVGGAEEPGEAAVQYNVEQEKPWLAYAQAGNIGTKQSGRWQERGGLIYRQLAQCDDVFLVDYLTSGFDKVHAVSTSYEAAFPNSDRLRWRVSGAWNEVQAADLGIANAGFTTTETFAGGELIYTFYQRDRLFLDAVAGVDYQYLTAEDGPPNGHGSLVLPHVGLRAEQDRPFDSFFATAALYQNAPAFADTGEDDLEGLGRADPDAAFTLLRWTAEKSFYIEPLLAREGGPAPGGLPAHELAGRFRGQTSFGSRLVPQMQDVIGGLYTVRGYPAAAAAGDNVLVGTFEYRLHVPRALGLTARPVPTMRTEREARRAASIAPSNWDWTAGPFVDLGRVTQADRQSGEFNQTLLGTGLGTELRIGRYFSLRLDWGVALRDTKNNQGDAGDQRVYVLATFSY